MPNDPLVNIIVPVYNEERILEMSVRRIIDFLSESAFPYRYRITIVDNHSSDGTNGIATALADEFPSVRLLSLNKKGKGWAVRQGWKEDGDIMSFMDVDLASDLIFFKPLIDAVAINGYDLGIGNRLGASSKVEDRRVVRGLVSQGYNIFMRTVFDSVIRDHQCGFKAISKTAYERIAPNLQDTNWFFDTELLVLAQREGYSIYPIDIVWKDDRNSKVSIDFKTSFEVLKATYALRKRLQLNTRIYRFIITGSLAAFATLGILYAATTYGHLWYLYSSVLGFIGGFIVSFLLSKFWTFENRALAGSSRQLVFHLSVALANLGINTVLLYMLVDWLGLWYLLAQAFASVAIAFESYFAYRWIYRIPTGSEVVL